MRALGLAATGKDSWLGSDRPRWREEQLAGLVWAELAAAAGTPDLCAREAAGDCVEVELV